jgi:hypothetical protein
MSNCPHCGAEAIDERHWGCGTIQHPNYVEDGCVKAGAFLRDTMCRWRECAEKLARLLRQRIDHDDDVFLDWEHDALAEFERLKEGGK